MNLFGTAGIRGPVRERVTPELALAVGRAAAAEAITDHDPTRDDDGPARDAEAPRNAETPTFVLARDGRTTGGGLADAVAAGLVSGGADVRRAGHLPTPALAYATAARDARDDGHERHGVMVTASHNPPPDNGLKLFAGGQEYDTETEARVSGHVERDAPPVAWDEWGCTEEIDPLGTYLKAVAAYASEYGASLEGISVAIDCANGMASLATPRVLRTLGAEVHTLYADVDGHFPGRGSKPTPESIGALREFVADGGSSLGIAHDGDADRIVIVDSAGEVVHEDTVVAILAERFVAASDAGDPVVVTTPNASSRIDERVAAAGGRIERVRLGALHEGIAAARAAGGESTEVEFAAEPWKHVHVGFGPWIDGVASAAVIARLVAEASGDADAGAPEYAGNRAGAAGEATSGLDALREPVAERPYRKASVACVDDRKEAVMERVEARLPEAVADAEIAATEHGVRIERPDGSWVLVRPSGTEPKLRLYVESEAADALLERARTAVEESVAEE